MTELAPADDRTDSLTRFERDAQDVARVLRPLANARRLMILCKLAAEGEVNVTDLAAVAGLSQSALSQHLAMLRAEGVVTFRRDRQTLWYRIADPRTEALIASLRRLYCNSTETQGTGTP